MRPVRSSTSINTWAFQPDAKRLQRARYLRVDTDGDGRPDSYVPGTSNFTPGGKRDKGSETDIAPMPGFNECHDSGGTGHQHCPGGTYIY